MIHCKKHSVLVSALAFSICVLLSVSFTTNATADNKILQYAQQDIHDEDLPTKTPQTVLNQGTKVLQPDKSEVTPSPTIQPEPNSQNKEILTATPQETQSAKDDTITKKQEITNHSDSTKQLSEPSPIVNQSNDNVIKKNDLIKVGMGTDIADVHKAIGVEAQSSNEQEKYKLDDGNTAVLVYENNKLKSGYIIKNAE